MCLKLQRNFAFMASYRYPGPRPFEESETNIFYGRTKDKKNLLTTINVEQLVVVFAKSGIGKSSLINAAILPELRKQNYEIINGRFNSYNSSIQTPVPNTAAEALSPIRKLLSNIKVQYKIIQDSIEKLHVWWWKKETAVAKGADVSFNGVAVKSLPPLDKLVADLKKESNTQSTFLDILLPTGNQTSLWHVFKNFQILNHKKNEKLNVSDDDHNAQKGYFIFFDQFEELFTYPMQQVNEFKHQLAELLFTAVPQRYLDQIRSSQSDPSLHRLEPWQRRLLYEPIPVKVLFTIRSDKFHLLTTLKDAIPSIVTKTYELHPFDLAEAENVIKTPAMLPGEFASNTFSYSREALEHMVDYLTDKDTEPIESFQLQILCKYLEDKVISYKSEKVKEQNKTGRVIAPEEMELKLITPAQLGDIKNIFEGYYTDLVKKIAPANETNVKRLFEEGLIFEKDKMRVSLYKQQITANYRIDKNLLDELVQTHLLTEETTSGGTQKYELSHDSLVEPILKSKERRVEAERSKNRNFKIGVATIIVFVAFIALFWWQKNTSNNAEVDNAKAGFLISERDWFHYLDTPQQNIILNNKAFFLSKKGDTLKYDSSKYTYKCAALSNKWKVENPMLSLKLAIEAVFNDSLDRVAKQTLNASIRKLARPAISVLGKGINNAHFSKDGQSIISATNKGIFWYHLNGGTTYASLKGNNYISDYSAFSADGSYIVYGSFSGNTIHLLNLHDTTLVSLKTSFDNSSHPLAFAISQNNERIVIASNYNQARVFSIKGKLIRSHNFPSGITINELAISPSGKFFAAATLGGEVYLSTNSSKPLGFHNDIINSISFSCDGKYILTGSSDSQVKVWDDSMHFLQSLKNYTIIKRCVFSSDNKNIYYGDKNGFITQFRADTNNITSNLPSNIKTGKINIKERDVSKNERKRNTVKYIKDSIHFINTTSEIKSIQEYKRYLLSSFTNEILLWNLDDVMPLKSKELLASLPRLTVSEKFNSGLSTVDDVLKVDDRAQVLQAIKLLKDSVQTFYIDTEDDDSKQKLSDVSNSIVKLYKHLSDCKRGILFKNDSLDLFDDLRSFYAMKVGSRSEVEELDMEDLEGLVNSAQDRLRVDTLYDQSRLVLIYCYDYALYFLKPAQYQTMVTLNRSLLNSKSDELKKLGLQYDIMFRLIGSDLRNVEIAKKALADWPPSLRGTNYELSTTLVQVFNTTEALSFPPKVKFQNSSQGLEEILRFCNKWIYTKAEVNSISHLRNRIRVFQTFLNKLNITISPK